jgi:hypothetical protein
MDKFKLCYFLFLGYFMMLDHIASNVSQHAYFGCLEESDSGLIKVLSQHLLGETEENHETPQSG